MKLEKLTAEQEVLMASTAQEWKDRFFNTKRIDKVAFEEGINWIYNDFLKLPNPQVVYCESWLEALLTIELLKTGANVGDNVRANVRANVEDNVWANVGASVWGYCCYISSYSNFGWVSFYDYFTKIGILNDEKFNKYSSLIKSRIYQSYTFENVVIAIQPPKHIHLDDEGRMNSLTEKAFEWTDGYGFYYVSGCNISEELFNKLKEDSITINDFLTEENEEVKSAIISYIQQSKGDAGVMSFFSDYLKEVDTYTDIKDPSMLVGTTNGQNIGVYTLFKGELNGVDIAYVRCFCPSTDRMFFLGVHPDNSNAKDAIASLYQVPSNLKDKIVSISRQGEKFSTIFDEQTTAMLESGSIEISDYVSLSGDDYFRLMSYEY